jgi:hypothetical protein
MPHRGPNAALRPKQSDEKNTSAVVLIESRFKSMTTMQLLGHGLGSQLHRQNGWLKALLQQEGTKISHFSLQISDFITYCVPPGILQDTPAALKERVGHDYNNQLSFIEGMRAVML